MRSIYTLLLFGIGLLLTTSCRPPETLPVLAQAETLMEEHSDSATVLLESISVPEKLSENNHALYCLLWTQANDKNYIEHTSDSLINIACHYYEGTEDSEHLMVSYYYLARVYQDLGDSMRAQEYYLKAIETGGNSANHNVLGRAYSNLGMIYIMQYLFDTAKVFQLKAYDHYKMANNSSGQSFALQNMARIHSMTPQPDSAIYYYEQALPLATKEDYYSILNELGGQYSEKKEYPKALEYVLQSINSDSINGKSIERIFTLGCLYHDSGELDSAAYYLTQCQNSMNLGVSAMSYRRLALIEKQKQNLRLSIHYNNVYELLRDSMEVAQSAETMQRMQSMFDYQQVEEEREYYELASDRKTIVIYKLLALSSIVIGICIGIIFFIQERNRKIEKQREQEKTDSKMSVSKQDSLIAEFSKTKVRHLFYESEKVVPENWTKLIGWIEVMYPDFTYRLKSLHPTISVTELQICYLIKIQVPVCQVSKLLSLTVSAVSHSRKRLYTKLTGKDGGSKALDLFLADF